MQKLILTLGLMAAMVSGTARANSQSAPQVRPVGGNFTAASQRTAPGEQPQAESELQPVPGDLRLLRNDVDIIINNGFATTIIDQLLENPTGQTLEATWSFPLPEEASLSELSLWIDGTQVVGEVVAKSEAQRIYEAERDAGESAALVQQNGSVDYRVSVSAVPPRSKARVRVVYFQSLDIDQGVGRYLLPFQEGNTADGGMNTSFWNMEKAVGEQMTLDVLLKTSYPVDGLHSPSHQGLKANQETDSTWSAHWDGEGSVLDKDFLLLYRLAENVPARVELLTSRYADQGEGTFMAVITPGEDLEEIVEGTDWMFVLDISGSMAGEKLRVLKQGVLGAISQLRSQDRFQVIEFNDSSSVLTSGWQPGGSTGSAAALAAVQSMVAGGGTNIFGALDRAYQRLDQDRPCAIVLVSDGVANTGPSEYRDFIGMAKKHDARLFTFVIGNGANVRLLGDLATLSGGFSKSVSVQDEVAAHLMLARNRMSHQALHGVRFELDGATTVSPRLLPSLYLGQQLVVFGRYTNAGPSELRVSARISGEERSWTIPVQLPEIDESNPELERLYALSVIGDLERDRWLKGNSEGETRDAIVDMAVAYSLVTDHTSMVVVRADRKAAYGLGTSNAERRSRESQAATSRQQHGNQVQVQAGSTPLGGSRAAHAPSRSRNTGRRGAGALGPFDVATVLGLVLLALFCKRGA